MSERPVKRFHQHVISDALATAQEAGAEDFDELLRAAVPVLEQAAAEMYGSASPPLPPAQPRVTAEMVEAAPASDGFGVMPRHATNKMMDAGLYHSSSDTDWASLFTSWHAMWDVYFEDSSQAALAAAPASLPDVGFEDQRSISVFRDGTFTLNRNGLDERYEADINSDWVCNIRVSALLATLRAQQPAAGAAYVAGWKACQQRMAEVAKGVQISDTSLAAQWGRECSAAILREAGPQQAPAGLNLPAREGAVCAASAAGESPAPATPARSILEGVSDWQIGRDFLDLVRTDLSGADYHHVGAAVRALVEKRERGGQG